MKNRVWISSILILSGLFIIPSSCNKDDESHPAISLTTAPITNVTMSFAMSGGTITGDGGSPITSRGICWSLLPDPTIFDFKTEDGNGTGYFGSTLTSLDSSTVYYVRAYAINANDTVYGNELSFSTLPFIYYSAIAAGSGHSFGLKTDGSLWAWGWNQYGQLGDGSFTNRQIPIKIGDGYSAIAAGGFLFQFSVPVAVGHSLGLKTDSSLWGWGSNDFGQVGDGSILPRKSPVLLGYGYKLLDAGDSHSFAIKSDGTLWGWGSDSAGQVGDSSLSNQLSPKLIGSDYIAIAAGGQHSLGIKSDGTLWTWGNNNFGQLGDGSVLPKKAPHYIGSGYAAVSAGYEYSMALKTDGTLWTWGNNVDGELGDGTFELRYIPVLIGSGFVSIAAGGEHSLALKTDGTLWAWGNNSAGQVGNGASVDINTPAMIGSGYTMIAAGDEYSLALKTDGTLWAWGLNFWGQLGDGTTINKNIPTLIGPH